jgi:hypothetical protein
MTRITPINEFARYGKTTNNGSDLCEILQGWTAGLNPTARNHQGQAQQAAEKL